MPPSLQVLTKATSQRSLSEQLFGGALLIFKAVPAVYDFCDLVDELAQEVFGGLEPTTAQFDLDEATFSGKVDTLQKTVAKHPGARETFLEALAQVGVDVEQTYWDKLFFRVSPHGSDYTGDNPRALKAHRDTWGSNVYQAVNWWAPIYPLTAERTITFFPSYWDKPVQNSTDIWDLEVIRAERRAGEPPSLPLVPEPLETAENELRILLEPGDLLAFSGAHLHASVPNTSGAARFSVETRTVNSDDVTANRAAPNVDGRAPRTAWSWFRHTRSGERLSEVVGVSS